MAKKLTDTPTTDDKAVLVADAAAEPVTEAAATEPVTEAAATEPVTETAEPALEASGLAAAVLAEAVAGYLGSPGGLALLAQLMVELDAVHTPPVTAHMPTIEPNPSVCSPAEAALRFGLDAGDILACRYYPDEHRWVVVTTDGRKLEQMQAEANHAV